MRWEYLFHLLYTTRIITSDSSDLDVITEKHLLVNEKRRCRDG